MDKNEAIITRLTNLSIKIYNKLTLGRLLNTSKNYQNQIYIPVLCMLCEQYHHQYRIICNNCYALLTPLGHACKHCCKPLISRLQDICNDCQQKTPAFTRVWTAFQYEEPLKLLMRKFKYNNALCVKSLLTEMMLMASIPQNEIGCLMPVPISKTRIQQRGYNQAAILAQTLAKKLNAPYSDSHLHKTIDTPNQVSITGAQRRKNLHNAFTYKESNYQVVTIVDDILTTGSTANEIALTLKNHGVKQVNIWCCARAK